MRTRLLLSWTLLLAAYLAGEPPSSGADQARGAAVCLEISAFSRGFRLCSRSTPSGMTEYWQVPPREMATVDSALLAYMRSSGVEKKLPMPVDHYQRQYLGFQRGKARMIYVNAFPARAKRLVRSSCHEFISGCDGGGEFWGIEFDTATKTFAEFATNY